MRGVCYQQRTQLRSYGAVHEAQVRESLVRRTGSARVSCGTLVETAGIAVPMLQCKLPAGWATKFSGVIAVAAD